MARAARNDSGQRVSSLGGDPLRALVCLADVEHPGGLDVDDFPAVLATHDRGDDLDSLLTLPDHAAGFQPAVKPAHVAGVRALGEDAFLILGAVGAEGVGFFNAPRTKAIDCARCIDSDSPTVERPESQKGYPSGHSPGHPRLGSVLRSTPEGTSRPLRPELSTPRGVVRRDATDAMRHSCAVPVYETRSPRHALQRIGTVRSVYVR